MTPLEKEIRDNWYRIVQKSGCNADPFPELPAGKLRLLSKANAKTAKNLKVGALTAGLALAPADLSGREICPFRTNGCTTVCLGHSAGHMSMSTARKAQQWRTALYFGDRGLFMDLLRKELGELVYRAVQKGLIPAARLDLFSDQGLAVGLAHEFPMITFYDYTKSIRRMHSWLDDHAVNRHLTFSYSGGNLADSLAVLEQGGTVAVVFDSAALPAQWQGYPVVNGDENDWRPGDEPGTVIGLNFKTARGRSAMLAKAGAFVVRV